MSTDQILAFAALGAVLVACTIWYIGHKCTDMRAPSLHCHDYWDH